MRIPETATGEFEPGDPVTGKPGSRLSSAYMNSDLREKLNVLRAAGIAQNNDDDAQLLAAIRRLITTATAVVAPPVRGGTGLDYVPPGNYLVGNGTATMTSKTPAQVLRDIGAIPQGGALRRVRLTTATDANTLIADHVYYTWSNSVVMGANFPNIRGTGYLLSYYMASDHIAQELTIVGNHKPRRFGRFGNPATGVWQPWWVMSSFSEDAPMPDWDAGDIYVDGLGWYLWNGTSYARSSDSDSGQIAYFATDRNPSGWLRANGANVSRLAYASLFSAIGTRYGAGDGATTFTLPDLRGEFIRGWDDGRQVDPGRGLGTWQADAFQGHWHQMYINALEYGTSNHYGSGDAASWAASSPIAGRIREAISDGVNGVPRTANETRPRNIALLACIKI
ncbi:phage tail protein [Achromobacter xylosoxidans]